jgi:hypothetical protein
MFKNEMRPVHAGEVLREDYLKPLRVSANALAKALSAMIRWRCAFVAESPKRLRSACSGNQQRQAHCAGGFTRRRLSGRG